MEATNLLGSLPSATGEEAFEVLARTSKVRIERIVSPPGHGSPAGFWYDQEDEEWVLLVEGGAVLELEGRNDTVELSPGDWVRIPAGCRHRVARTAETTTVWLAVHYPPEPGSSSDASSPSVSPRRRQ